MLPVIVGCVSQGDQSSCREELLHAQAQSKQLSEMVARQQLTITDQQQQIDNLQALGPDRLERLYTVDTLEIVPLSGGYDTDDIAGDEGVVVYIRPRDAQGDVIKAAGSLKLTVFDLDAPEGDHTVGQIELNPEELSKYWHGKLLAQHFTVRCGFDRPIVREHLTVRVAFTELLTGKTHLAQRLVDVTPPSPADPA